MPTLTDIHQSVARSSVRAEALPLTLAPYREPPHPLWVRFTVHAVVAGFCTALVCLSWEVYL